MPVRPTTTRPRRLLALSLLAGGAALLAPQLADAATPGTLRLTGTGAAHDQVTVTRPGGATTTARPGIYRYLVTPDGSATRAAQGYCVDMDHTFRTGVDYDVSFQTAADDLLLGSPDHRSVGWLLRETDALLAAAADDDLEAGAIQIAVWQLTDQLVDGAAPTSDAELNARAAELRAQAAGKGPRDTLAVDVVPEDPCSADAAPVTVSGEPGTQVHVSASGGAEVSPANLTIDGDGVVETHLTAPGAGPVEVTAVANGERLVRATRLPGQVEPQQQALIEPVELSASDAVTFVDCPLLLDPPPPPPPPDPDPPIGTLDTGRAPAAAAGPPAARPSVRRSAAAAELAERRAAARAGLRARATLVRTRGATAVYEVTVTNDGGRVAAGVRLRARAADRTLLRARGAWRSAARWGLGTVSPDAPESVLVRVRAAGDAEPAAPVLTLAAAAPAR